jgi:hypothetical protein
VLYHSKELESDNPFDSLWFQGFHRIGNVTYDSVRYVAKYITKKLDGDMENEIMEGEFLRHYERYNPDTNQIVTVNKEFCETPRRPGLGNEFVQKYWKELYPSDTVVFNKEAVQTNTKYFDRVMEKINPDMLERVISKRRDYVLSQPEEYTKERMETKEGIIQRKHDRYTQLTGAEI